MIGCFVCDTEKNYLGKHFVCEKICRGKISTLVQNFVKNILGNLIFYRAEVQKGTKLGKDSPGKNIRRGKYSPEKIFAREENSPEKDLVKYRKFRHFSPKNFPPIR